MSDQQQRINALYKQAKECDDPRVLRSIAILLRELGAWDKADTVLHFAVDVERQQAERVAR